MNPSVPFSPSVTSDFCNPMECSTSGFPVLMSLACVYTLHKCNNVAHSQILSRAQHSYMCNLCMLLNVLVFHPHCCIFEYDVVYPSYC